MLTSSDALVASSFLFLVVMPGTTSSFLLLVVIPVLLVGMPLFLPRRTALHLRCGVPATDLAFAPDGRWLAAAVCDGGLRIFDLPAARCIDSFLFAQPALGLCFSPSGAFLVTSHAKNNAIQVWANKWLVQRRFWGSCAYCLSKRTGISLFKKFLASL